LADVVNQGTQPRLRRDFQYSTKFRAIEISIKETSSVSAEILSAISRQTILALSMKVIHSHTVVESIFKILDGFGEVHLLFSTAGGLWICRMWLETQSRSTMTKRCQLNILVYLSQECFILHQP
jgi:NADP-dependent 3-hydroxy acid dehydrogenase YdfG